MPTNLLRQCEELLHTAMVVIGRGEAKGLTCRPMVKRRWQNPSNDTSRLQRVRIIWNSVSPEKDTRSTGYEELRRRLCWYNGANAFELNREGLSANQTALWVPHLAGYPEYLVKCCRRDQSIRRPGHVPDRPDRQSTWNTSAISNVKEFEVDSARGERFPQYPATKAAGSATGTTRPQRTKA